MSIPRYPPLSLRRPAPKPIPAPPSGGCRIEPRLDESFDSLMRRFKKAVAASGRGPAKARLHHETKGQRCRRKRTEAIKRANKRRHLDP